MTMDYKQYSHRIDYSITQSTLGLILIAASSKGVCWMQFGEDDLSLIQALQKQYPLAKISSAQNLALNTFKNWIQEIESYLQGKSDLNSLPLDMHGTEFQITVWKHLKNIPLGTLTSYQKLAESMASPKSVRAIAKACATNHIALAIPCHRVVKSDGKLAGYRWGLELKAKLIEIEKAQSQLDLF